MSIFHAEYFNIKMALGHFENLNTAWTLLVPSFREGKNLSYIEFSW